MELACQELNDESWGDGSEKTDGRREWEIDCETRKLDTQILVQSRGDRILIAPAVPDSWEDYSFKLACHGNLVVTVAVRGGRLERLVLTPADSGVERTRTLVIPERLIDTDSIQPGAIRSMTTQDGCCRMTVGFERELALVGTAQEGGAEPDDKGNEGKGTR